MARAPDGAIVVVEVKAAGVAPRGRARRFRPGLHLGPDQAARLARAARELAVRHGVARWRVELAEVEFESTGAQVTTALVARSEGPPGG